MPFSLIPKLILPSLTDVTPELLAARGVRFLMLDFDNTIVPYTTNEPAEAMTAWLRRMQASEIRLCVVSNSRKPRVVEFCKKYGLDCIHTRKSRSSAASAHVSRDSRSTRRPAPSRATRSTQTSSARTARG